MSENKTVNDILENIEKEYRMLAELCGVTYITGTLLDGCFMLWSNEKNGKKPIDRFNEVN